jgi:hypothetical protein
MIYQIIEKIEENYPEFLHARQASTLICNFYMSTPNSTKSRASGYRDLSKTLTAAIGLVSIR